MTYHNKNNGQKKRSTFLQYHGTALNKFLFHKKMSGFFFTNILALMDGGLVNIFARFFSWISPEESKVGQGFSSGLYQRFIEFPNGGVDYT